MMNDAANATFNLDPLPVMLAAANAARHYRGAGDCNQLRAR